jgi:hypothetical protein
MQQTFFTLLTSKKERRARYIRASLDREFLTAGAPWFTDKLLEKTASVKIISSTK